ncbi:MAG: U32 family peptidase [Oscillospiraceae bacterium]|nr:U32 family peptidase [Oscillospiraceae bacterium]
MTKTVELLSPAGDAERLKMAVAYGADAVYLAGKEFGMRAGAANFSDDDLEHAVQYCHEHGVKAYITCNILPHDSDLVRLPAFLGLLSDIGADAVIIADLGVLASVKKHAPRLKFHISTQFGAVNSETANYLYSLGADTIVLARELNLSEIRQIRRNTPDDLGLECFVHGAMCVSFSGRCLLSNYLTGRDSNRGNCAQPCRWKYRLLEESRPGEYFPVVEDDGTYIFNSKDLCMIEHIPELLDAGVTSLKIEGRMKSFYYTAVTAQAYRKAIDAAVSGVPLDPLWVKEVDMVSHRPYTTGFYFDEPEQYYADSSYTTAANVVAVVESCSSEGDAVLSQRNKFFRGDELEIVIPGGVPVSFRADKLFDENGSSIESTPRAMMIIKTALPCAVPPMSIIRKRTVQ